MSKSSTITSGRNGLPIRVRPPIHPGEILLEEFLEPLRLKPYTLAKRLLVPRARIERLVRGQASMTAEMALRLSRFFGNSPEFWMNMQTAYDLTVAEDLAAEVTAEITPLPREDRDAA